MQGSSNFGAPSAGFFDGFINPQAAIYLFAGLLVVACAGSLVGLLSRNIVLLLGVLAAVAGFLFFHMYLPLPENIQTEIFLFKARIGL